MDSMPGEYRTCVLTRRLKLHGVVETMSEQVPEVREAFRALDQQLPDRMQPFAREGWRILSNSHSIYNGILIVTLLLGR